METPQYTLVRGNGTTTVNWSTETRERLLTLLEYPPDRDQALDFIEAHETPVGIARSGSFVILPSTGWLLFCTFPYAEPDNVVVGALVRALKVLVLTPHIKSYLAVSDPNALEQATKALCAYQETQPRVHKGSDPLLVGDHITQSSVLSVDQGGSWGAGLFGDHSNRRWYVTEKGVVVAVYEDGYLAASREYQNLREKHEGPPTGSDNG